jgi:hypothetical protein
MPSGAASAQRRDYGRPVRKERSGASGFDGHKKLTNRARHLLILVERSVDISTQWQGIIVTGMNVTSIEVVLDACGDHMDRFAVTQLP